MSKRTTRTKPKPERKPSDSDLARSAPGKKSYPEQHLAGLRPWQPGQSGNPAGRPLGARPKLSEAFIAGVLATWEKHGNAALEWMVCHDPAGFVHAVGMLV